MIIRSQPRIRQSFSVRISKVRNFVSKLASNLRHWSDNKNVIDIDWKMILKPHKRRKKKEERLSYRRITFEKSVDIWKRKKKWREREWLHSSSLEYIALDPRFCFGSLYYGAWAWLTCNTNLRRKLLWLFFSSFSFPFFRFFGLFSVKVDVKNRMEGETEVIIFMYDFLFCFL